MKKFEINYNYLIDMYPFRSMIIIMSLVVIGGLFFHSSLFIPGALLYILFMILISIRTFFNGKKGIDKFYGQWFLKRNNYFFMYKPIKNLYSFNNLELFTYYFNPSKNFQFVFFDYKQIKYESRMTNEYDIDFSYSRFANKKEIEKYNLNNMEAKILLSSKND